MSATSVGARRFLVFVFMSLVAQSSLAQFQGKIFTTPEERAYLDALREDFLNKSQDQGFDLEDAGPPPLPETTEVQTENTTPVEYTLGGILTRSDGSHTVWLNNQPVAETDLPANMRLVSDGQLVVLRITSGTSSFQLKPGQTLNASTGEIQEAYQRALRSADDVDVPAPASDAEAVLPAGQSPLDPNAQEALSDSPAPEASAEADTRETP